MSALVLFGQTETRLIRKNVITLSRYNSNIHESILIHFGKNVTEKVGNQKLFYFPTSPKAVVPC